MNPGSKKRGRLWKEGGSILPSDRRVQCSHGGQCLHQAGGFNGGSFQAPLELGFDSLNQAGLWPSFHRVKKFLPGGKVFIH